MLILVSLNKGIGTTTDIYKKDLTRTREAFSHAKNSVIMPNACDFKHMKELGIDKLTQVPRAWAGTWWYLVL